jgi:hypothetical protein
MGASSGTPLAALSLVQVGVRFHLGIEAGHGLAQLFEVTDFQQGAEVFVSVLRSRREQIAERVLGENRRAQRRLREHNPKSQQIGLSRSLAINFESGLAVLVPAFVIIAYEGAANGSLSPARSCMAVLT